MNQLGRLTPIIEGKLYSWARLKLEYPDAPISSAYQHIHIRPSEGEMTSQQERWVIRHQYDLWDASVIEHTLPKMSEPQRRLVHLRYVEGWSWKKVAEKMYLSRRSVYYLRDQIVLILAYEFGLLRDVRGRQAS